MLIFSRTVVKQLFSTGDAFVSKDNLTSARQSLKELNVAQFKGRMEKSMHGVKMFVYIDDESDLNMLIEDIFNDFDAMVKTFNQPSSALDFINSSAEVCCVICDYRMPKMDGISLFKNIKRSIPFYLVSGDLSIDLGDYEGKIQVLKKPVKEKVLAEIIKKHQS